MNPESHATASSEVLEVAVVAHNVLALHAQADRSSEQISQLLLGASVSIFERSDDAKMVYIEGDDRYRGWAQAKYLAAPQDHSDNPRTTIASLIADVHSSPNAASQIVTKLTVTTSIAMGRHSSEREFTPLLLPDGTTGYTHRGNLSSTYQREVNGIGEVPSQSMVTEQRAKMLDHVLASISASALRFVGTPYLWGGSTPFGIDCSGLSQLCYKIVGIQLLRDASLQIDDKRFAPVSDGIPMPDASFAAGDLIFFRSRKQTPERSIGHVGIAIGDGSFVHAAGGGCGVTVTPCDDERWVPLYAGARRILPNTDLAIQAA